MKKDEKFCKILVGAVLLEVGVLGAVGLAIAAAASKRGARPMRSGPRCTRNW